MKLQYILILIIIYIIIHIWTYIIHQLLSPNLINIYTSFITILLIIITIDSYYLLNEIQILETDNKSIQKLLNIQIMENKKLEKYIKDKINIL